MANLSSHKWLSRQCMLALTMKTAAQILADNLTALMRDHPALNSQPRVAKKSGVGQSTVGRALKGEISSTLGSADALANAFGLETWQLIHPTMGSRAPDKLLAVMLDSWQQLSDESKSHLVATASRLYALEHPPQSPTYPAPITSVSLINGPAADYKAALKHPAKKL